MVSTHSIYEWWFIAPNANVVKAVGFYGITPRIVVKVHWSVELLLNGTPGSSWISIISSGLDVFDSERSLTSALTLFCPRWFFHSFGSNVLSPALASFNESPCCLQTEPTVCPWWCWMQASHSGGHVLLTRSCSYGNTAGSAGLCTQPVCQFDSKDWFPVITRTHSSFLPSETFLNDFRSYVVAIPMCRDVLLFVCFFYLSLNDKRQGSQTRWI